MAKTIIHSHTPEAEAFFENAQDTIKNLYYRWQDESEHEDINDYINSLHPIADGTGVLLLKMTKRPFGVIFVVGNRKFKITRSATKYSYKRIA